MVVGQVHTCAVVAVVLVAVADAGGVAVSVDGVHYSRSCRAGTVVIVAAVVDAAVECTGTVDSGISCATFAVRKIAARRTNLVSFCTSSVGRSRVLILMVICFVVGEIIASAIVINVDVAVADDPAG